MRKIMVVTGTRAEYGLLKNTIKKIENSKLLELQLVVTGAHLSHKYGYTVQDIVDDGFRIEEKIPILLEGESEISKEMGLLMVQLSQTMKRLKPDVLLILGDRYEIFAAVSVAMAMNIPIAHISGGEVTEGAIDEQIRHAITKMAHIHFPGAKIYGENIANMGEESWRIFDVGDPGIENIKLTKFLSKEELEQSLGVSIDTKTLLVTFHPVTLERKMLESQIDNLLEALEKINGKKIITYPNSDNGGEIIIERLKQFAEKNKDVFLFKSLGILRYLSVMKLCGAIVGNSSSALVEAPFLKKPVVNIGNRQKGRLTANNIICCGNDSREIKESIDKALSTDFKITVGNTESLYGEGNTSKDIVSVLEKMEINDKLLKKKLSWR